VIPAFVLALALVTLLAALLHHQRARSRTLASRVEKSARELERLQTAFARFAPPAVVDDIARGRAVQAEKREVTVLFADLKGFTSLSDKLDAAVLVRILNGYFGEMSRAITAHRGHVAKFLGDGIMALFGATENNPWQARDAVEAALEMRASLVRYNAALRGDGLPELAFGIGIHRGVAVAGILGSDELMEFTVIGDTVNVAARVESMTRTHDVDILVTEDVRSRLDARFEVRTLPPTPVKGKAQPIATWAVEKLNPSRPAGSSS
jgi:adenylate cyclase